MTNDPAIEKKLAIFNENPKDTEAFQALEESLFLANKWEQLVAIYQTRIQALQNDAQAAARLYFKQGEFLEKRLSQPHDAFCAYEQAYYLAPGEEEYLQTLVKVGEGTQEWEKLLKALEHKLSKTKATTEQSAILLQMGKYHLMQLNDPEKAVELLRQAVESDSGCGEALELLERIYNDVEDWESLVEIYYFRYQSESSRDQKIRLLRQCAIICEEQLQQTPRAIEFYEKLTELDPADNSSLNSLESLYSQTEQWSKVIDAMEGQLAMLGDKAEQVRVLTRIAIIWSEKLKDLDHATRCYERASEIQEDPMILQILEESYTYQENWEKLAEIYEKMARLAGPAERKDFYLTLAELSEEKLCDVNAAIQWYQSALQEAPQETPILKNLQRLLKQQGAFEELLAAYRKELATASGKSEKIKIYHEMAMLLVDHEHYKEAAEIYEEAISFYPKEIVIFERLRDLYQELDQPENLLNVLVRESELLDKEKRISCFREIAELLRKKLHRDREAINYYQKILELSPGNLEVLRILKSYYTKQQAYQPLIETTEKIAELDADSALSGYLEIARIQWENLKDVSSAISSYRKVLSLSPNYLDAWRALKALYKHKKLWADYINACQKILALVASIDDKIAIEYDLVDLYNKQKLAEKTASHLRQVLELKPDHEKTIERLKQLYRDKQNWESLAQIFIHEAQVLEHSGPLGEKYRETAKLFQENLDDSKQAIFYYRKAHLLLPDDVDILDQLDILYRQTESFNKLVHVLENKARLSNDPEQAASVLFQAAKIYLEELKQPKSAQEACQKVLTHKSGHEQALELAEQIYLEAEEVAELAAFYDRQIKIAVDKELQLSLHLKAAKLGDEKLSDLGYAILHYHAILKLEPGHKQALDCLIDLYRLEQKWQELANIYEKRIKVAENREELADNLHELAAIYRQHLDWEQRAFACYYNILELDAKNLKAIYALEEMCRKNKRWTELVEVLERKIKLTGKPEKKLPIYCELGRLCRENTCQFTEAIEFYSRALKLDRENEEILAALHALYRQTDNFSELLNIIECRLNLQQDAGQVELLAELAEIHEKLDEPEKAADALKSILNIDEKNKAALDNLSRIYQERQQYAELLDLWEAQIYQLDFKEQTNLAVRMAYLLSEQLQEDERAQEVLQQTLEMDAKCEPARAFLALLYTKHEKWQDLVDLYQDELTISEDKKRTAWLFAASGRLWHYHLGDFDKALEMYEQSLELLPGELPVLKQVQNIYRQRKNWSELAKTYGRELDVDTIDKVRKISLFLKVAELNEVYLKLLDQAERNYAAVLADELDPGNLVAIRGLERIYRENRQYEKLQKMLLKELEVQQDPVREIELYVETAVLKEEKLGDIDGAKDYYSEALEHRQEDLFIIRRLKAIYKKQDDLPAYTELVEKEIELVKSPFELLELHNELISVYYEIERPDKSIEHGEALLGIDPAHKETILALEQLYGEMENSEKLAAVYMEEAKLVEGDKDRLLFVYCKAGKAYRKLDQAEQAIACFEKIIELQPYHQESVSQLIELFTQCEKWEELCQLYQLASSFTEDKEREELHMSIASLAENELSDPELAFVHYQIAYHIDTENIVAVQGMRKILEEYENWMQALEMLNVEANLLDDEQKRATIYFKMGKIWQDKLNRPYQAIRCYFKVIEHAFQRETAERLSALLEQAEDWKGLAEVLEKDVRATNLKSEELPDKLFKLGHVYWKHLEKLDDAIRVYTALLKLDNKNEQALTAMENLLERQEQWSPLTAILKQRLQKLTGEEDATEQESKKGFLTKGARYQLQVKIARIYRDEMHSGDQAIIYYEKALEIMPKSLEPIHRLQELYSEWGCFQKLIDLYQKEISLIEEQKRIVELYHLIGDVWETRLFDSQRAIQTYRELMSVCSDVKAADALKDLYLRSEQWEELPKIYDILIQDSRDRNEFQLEIDLNKELGKLYQQQLNSPKQAIDTFQHVLELELLDEEAFKGLEILYEGENRIAELADLLEDKVKMIKDPESMMGVQIKLGKLYEERLKNTDKAIECFNKVLVICEGHAETLKALHRLYMQAENWERLAEVAREELEVVKEPLQQAELCFLLGNLLRENFDDMEQAHYYFLQALEILPSHVPSLLELSQIELGKKNWEQAASYMDQACLHIEKPDEQVALLTSLGNLYLDELDQPEKACETFERALKLKPDAVEPLEVLCEVYYRGECFAKLEPLLETLVALVPENQVEKLAKLSYRRGQTAEFLEHIDDALGRYCTALKYDPEHIGAMLGLGEIYWNRDDLTEALEIYEIAYQKEGMPDKPLVLYRLGILSEKLKHYPQAIAYYEKFLEISDEIPPEVLHSLAQIYIKKEDYSAALPYLERIIDGDYTESEMYAALKEKACIADRMGETEQAAELYLQVYSYSAQESVAGELVKLYMELKDWEEATKWNQTCYQTIEKDARRVENRLVQSRIFWEGLKSPLDAIAACQEALEIDPCSLKAVQGIANIYLRQKQWQKVVDCYHSFLGNLPKSQKKLGLPIRIALGNLYKDILEDVPGAIEHFEKALEIEPEHKEAQISVTELKSQLPELSEDAIKGHRMLLRRDQFRTSSYQALYHLLRQKGENDFAVRVYRALDLLAPEDCEEFTDVRWQPQPPKNIPFEAVVKFLIPSRINAMREVMALTGEHHEKIYAPELEKKYGVRKKEHLAAESVQKPVWYYANKIMQTLEFKDLHMYINPKPGNQVFIENTTPPSLLISQSLINQFSEQEMKFLLAKHLFYIWQKQTLAAKLGIDELKIYFYILRSSFVPVKKELSPDAEALQKKLHNNLPWKLRKTLKTHTKLWEQLAGANLTHYLKCLEYSSNRLGLLVTDSLELSINMLYHLSQLQKGEPLEKKRPIAPEKLKKVDGVCDLMLFNISDQYGNLRKACKIGD